jgi:hypothetical protein
MKTSARARHTCGGPMFGRLTAGCPRCDELAAGAEPIRQAWRESRKCRCGRPAQKGYIAAICRVCEISEHSTSARHRNGGCGPVCTFGDW